MNDWKNVFGIAPDSFERSMRVALCDVKEKEAMRKTTIKRPKLRVALAAACILLLATTAYAAAAHFGLIDFFGRSGNQLPEEAQNIIETNVPQETADTELVKFSVREAVCDSEHFYVVVEARPIDADKYLLLCMDANPGDPVSNAGIEGAGSFAGLAKQEGKDLLHVDAAISHDGTWVSESADYTMEVDGTIVMMLSGRGQGSAGSQIFTCETTVAAYDENGEYSMDNMKRASFPFTLDVSATGDVIVYTQAQPTVVEGAGVVVEKVEFTRTELGIYAELTFTIDASATEEEKARAADGLWFEYIDANGDRLADGLTGSGSIDSVGEGSFVQKTSLAAMETIPDTITVRAFDCWEKTRYGSITLER